jgi:hypothetical protein
MDLVADLALTIWRGQIEKKKFMTKKLKIK